MQRAKVYMQKLAVGINPIDDSIITNDSALKNERLSKCFTYIAEILENDINNIGHTKSIVKKSVKKDFTITPQQIQNIHTLSKDCTISELADEINQAVKNSDCKKLTSKVINDWMVNNGYLKNVPYGNGKTRREPTEKAAAIGIITKQGIGSFGDFTIILYSEQAQQYIIDHLTEIAAWTGNLL